MDKVLWSVTLQAGRLVVGAVIRVRAGVISPPCPLGCGNERSLDAAEALHALAEHTPVKQRVLFRQAWEDVLSAVLIDVRCLAAATYKRRSQIECPALAQIAGILLHAEEGLHVVLDRFEPRKLWRIDLGGLGIELLRAIVA